MLTPDRIRTLYRQGKRRFKSDDIWFRIKRGGPGNNYLTAYPEDERRFAPVANLAYDLVKEQKHLEARRSELPKSPYYHRKKAT